MENYFEIKKHEGWLYSIQDKLNVFCWLVVGEEAALLLDTGFGTGDLQGAVKSVTEKPLTVVLSHGHSDHSLGAYQFEKVFLHPKDFPICLEHCGVERRQKTICLIKESGEGLNFTMSDTDAERCLAKTQESLVPLEENTVFELGGMAVKTIPMPGHTAGSIGLLIPERKTLLAADSACRFEFMFLPESLNLVQYLETLRKTAELDFETHYIGHQDRPYPKQWFERYIQVAENALAGKGVPTKIPGFEDYDTLVSAVGGLFVSPNYCAVAYTEDKL